MEKPEMGICLPETGQRWVGIIPAIVQMVPILQSGMTSPGHKNQILEQVYRKAA